MAQVMLVIMRLSRENGVVNDVSSMNTVTRVQGVTEGPVYPPANPVMLEVGISHCLVPPLANVIPETYPSPLAPMSYRGVYTYPYMNSPVISSPPVAQVKVNMTMLFTQALPGQNSKE